MNDCGFGCKYCHRTLDRVCIKMYSWIEDHFLWFASLCRCLQDVMHTIMNFQRKSNAPENFFCIARYFFRGVRFCKFYFLPMADLSSIPIGGCYIQVTLSAPRADGYNLILQRYHIVTRPSTNAGESVPSRKWGWLYSISPYSIKKLGPKYRKYRVKGQGELVLWWSQNTQAAGTGLFS